MSKFSLNSLGKALSEKSGLSPVEAELFIRKMFDVCNQGLDQDKLVKMKWLGTFKVQAVKDRESINVNTGERIVIEGRDKLSFTPDNILKEIVNKPFAQFETVVVNDGVDFDAIDKKFEGEEGGEEAKDEIKDEIKDEASPIAEDSASQVIDETSPIAKEATSQVVDETNQMVNEAKSPELKEETKEQQKETKEQQEDTKKPQQEDAKEKQGYTGISADLQSDEQASLSQPASVEPANCSSEQASLSQQASDKPASSKTAASSSSPTSEVIDFLDTEAPAKPNSDVIIIGEKEPEDHPLEPEAPVSDGHHLLIPRYMVVAASIIVVALIAGMGWFAFNYGKMAAQRDNLAMQLNKYHQAPASKSSPAKPSAQAQMSQEQLLRQKAIEDSIRMAQASEAVKAAELAEKSDNAEATEQTSSQSATNAKAQKQANAKAELAAESKAKQAAEAKAKQAAESKAKQAMAKSSKYDSDARIRTGAYRITGVAEVVTVKAGQNIENISKRYLGPGMECYVEAINGTTTVKEGQKIKIPKLELKKKK